MSDKADNIYALLNILGLGKDETNLLLYLWKNGPTTALKLSKDLHVARTKVYRLTDKLLDRGLLYQKLSDRGLLFDAEPPEKLKLMLLEKENQVNSLKSLMPAVLEELKDLRSPAKESTKVTYYKGLEGLKQVTWNSLRAEKEILIFEMKSDMSTFLPRNFSEKVREEIVARRIHVRQITNLKHIVPFTRVTAKVEKYWEPRYLPPSELKITYEVIIYNDIVCMYNFLRQDVFCVEIQDKSLASMQKQIFSYLWKKALKMKKVGSFGEAILPH